MALDHKNLTSAKVRAAREGIESLLDRTERDDRLDSGLRAKLRSAAQDLGRLYTELWHDEFLRSTKKSGV